MWLSLLSGRRSEVPGGAWRLITAGLRQRSFASSASGLALIGALILLPGGAGASAQAFLILGIGVAAVLAVVLPVHWLLYAAILAIPFDNFAVPVGPLSISVSDVVLVVVALRWLLQVAASGGRIARSELYAPAALFYALLLPSFFVTFDRAVSTRLAFAILMMLMTAVMQAKRAISITPQQASGRTHGPHGMGSPGGSPSQNCVTATFPPSGSSGRIQGFRLAHTSSRH